MVRGPWIAVARLARAIAARCAAGALAGLVAAVVVGHVAAQPASAQADRPTVCHPDVDSGTTVAPKRILRASTVIVDTRLGFSCAAPIEPLHAVLVADAAVVAADAGVRGALADLPARLQPAANPYALLGRIDFGPGLRTQCGLTRSASELAVCLAGDAPPAPPDEPPAAPDPPDPWPSLADGVRKATRMLVATRDDDPPSPTHTVRAARDLIVVIAGASTAPAAPEDAAWCAAAAPALAAADAAGIELRLACADGACAQSCLARTLAAIRGDGDGVGGVHDAAEELVGRVWATEARVWRLIVREGLHTLPNPDHGGAPFPAWSIVPNSLRPAMPHHTDDTVIRWQLTQPMSSTVRLSYMVRPRVELGTVPLRQRAANASLAFVMDTRDGFGVYPLDNPSLVVAGWGPFAVFLPFARRDLVYDKSF